MIEEDMENSKIEDITNPDLEGFILREIPFVGMYSTKVFQKKNQSTVPSDLRTILKLRQGVKKIKDLVLFYQLEEGRIYLLDNPNKEACPDLNLINMDVQGRIVLPHSIFTKEYTNYIGRGSHIEVIPADHPYANPQITE